MTKLQVRPSEHGFIRDLETNKILAYQAQGQWKVLSKNVEHHPDPTLRISLCQFISSNPSVTEQEMNQGLIGEFRKIYDENRSKYRSTHLENTLIAFELDQKSILGEQQNLASLLELNGIKSEIILNPHISLSFLDQATSIQKLEESLLEVAQKKNWYFKIKNLKILPGLRVQKDFIALELQTPTDFLSLIDSIYNQNPCTRFLFPEGFKAHLSLLCIEKDQMSSEVIKKISEIISTHVLTISPTIRPKYATLFNNARESEIRKKMFHSRQENHE